MLSNKLKKLRATKKLTQSEVAEKISVARTTYAMYEQGNREPDYKTLNKIADFYDVTFDYLIGESDEQNKSEENSRDKIIHKIATEFPDIDLMFNDLANMSADDLQDVYDFIKFKKSQKS